MKKSLAQFLRRIADWLDGPQTLSHILITPALEALAQNAEFCVRQVQEKFADLEGEFKASQAYRMMLNIHPEADKSDIKLALELAVKRCLGQ